MNRQIIPRSKVGNRQIFSIFAILLLLAGFASAATLNVPGSYSTIQQAINVANPNDIIVIEPNVYTGIGNRNLGFAGKAITLRSIDPNDPNIVANTIIDCQGIDRAFYFRNDEDANSKVLGLTIINGYSPVFGGAIECEMASPTIANCVISNSSAADGGAIDCWAASPVIQSCVITDNTATFGGGAIECYASNPLIVNCLIKDNQAGDLGGAIRCDSSSPTLTFCTIVNNSDSSTTGGVYADFLSSPIIGNSILWDNTGDLGGSGSISITYSDIEDGDSGTGNIHSNPLFATGPMGDYFQSIDPNIGDYYLRQTPAQLGPITPCYNASNGVLSLFGLSTYTTRTDSFPDTAPADMGFHYPDTGTPLQFTLITNVVDDPNYLPLHIGHGSVSPLHPSPGVSYDKFTEVALTAMPDANYMVFQWTGTDDDNSVNFNNVVTMTENKTVNVEFAPCPLHSLTVVVINGVGGTVSPSTGLQCDGIIALTAIPDAGYQVKKWTGTFEEDNQTVNHVQMDQDRTVYIEFVTNTVSLSVHVIGGNGTVFPFRGNYPVDANVMLTASPDIMYKIKKWTGTNDDTSKSTINFVTMNESKNVTVEFEQFPGYFLTTYVRDGINLDYTVTGTISVNGGPGVTTFASYGPFADGTVINLQALPTLLPLPGYSLQSWSGTDDDSLTTLTNTVTINGSSAYVEAKFVKNPPSGLDPNKVFLYDRNGIASSQNPYTTIQAAIDDAGIEFADPCYSVVVAAMGTFTGPNNVDLHFRGFPMTVRSEFGPEYTTIDCNGSPSEPHRAFVFPSPAILDANGEPNELLLEDPNFIVKGFTITNGYAINGGAMIFDVNCAPVIDNCIFTNNYADSGGAMAFFDIAFDEEDVNSVVPRITGCKFTNNRSQSHGGAIYCNNGSPWVINTEIMFNQAGLAGSGSGGGVYCSSGSAPKFINCLVTDNYSVDHGGAFYLWESPADINLCTIMYNDSGFINTAQSEGWPWGPVGGIAARVTDEDAEPIISHCIIGRSGGRVGFWGSLPTRGDDLYNCSATYSCIENGDEGDGNIDRDPLFVLGGLGEFYLSQTRAGQGAQSPCIDAAGEYTLWDIQAAYGIRYDDPYHRYLRNWSTNSTRNHLDNGYADMGFHFPLYNGPVILTALQLSIIDGGFGFNGRLRVEWFDAYGILQTDIITPDTPMPAVRYAWPGSLVALTALPDPGYRVLRWTGTENNASFAVDNEVTMSGDQFVTIEFELIHTSTIHVPGEFPYLGIQEAIDQARDGDTIVIAPGTYPGGTYHSRTVLDRYYNSLNVYGPGYFVTGKNITITSTNPEDPDIVAATVIDCEGENGGGFHLYGNQPGSCLLNGITIRNSHFGGGSYSSATVPGADGGSGIPYANLSLFDWWYFDTWGTLVIFDTSAISVFGNHIVANCVIEHCNMQGTNGGNGATGNEGQRGGSGGNGDAVCGAGIRIISGEPNIINCTIDNCVLIPGNGGNGATGGRYAGGGDGGVPGQAYGAGIYIGGYRDYYHGLVKPTFINCTVKNCRAIGGRGGNGGDTGSDDGYYGGYGGLTLYDPDQDNPWNLSANGAGVYCDAQTFATFIDCDFINNTTTGSVSGLGGVGHPSGVRQVPRQNNDIPSFGGGVYCATDSNAVFTRCNFSGNETEFVDSNFTEYTGYGGGLACKDTFWININDCNFADNSASVGGGIYGYGATNYFNIADSNLTENTSFIGGGLAFFESTVLDMNDCVVRANLASEEAMPAPDSNDPNAPVVPQELLYGSGGGLYIFTTDADITNCVITENRCSGSGAGVYMAGNPTTLVPYGYAAPGLKNCLITNNTAIRDGGGVSCNWQVEAKISNCSIVNNATTLYGGGLYCTNDSNVAVIDSIIWDNYGQKGAQVAVEIANQFDLNRSPLEISYSDVGPDYDPNAGVDTNEPNAPKPVNALEITTTDNPTTLASEILGEGVTIENLSFTGDPGSAGTFKGGLAAGIGIESGIILTCGDAMLALPPNNSGGASKGNNTAGDPDLEALIGNTTNDATVLEFDFVTKGGDLFFNYVFASEEYNEWVYAFNDVFAFFLDGKNIALVPGKTTQVSINSINGGNPYGTNASNEEFYNNNDLNDGGPFYDIQYDGFTTVLTAQAFAVGPGTHHIKLAIADAFDTAYDSAVFIEADSLTGIRQTYPPIYIEDDCNIAGFNYNNPDEPNNPFGPWEPDFTNYHNIVEDPNFVYGYYISQFAAGQPYQSNCIDGGSAPASVLGLGTYTTSVNGGNDVDIVDMGYHYKDGLAQYYLTIDVVDANGTVLGPTDPGLHGTVEPNNGWYYDGDVVELIVHPDDGYRIRQWTGTDDDISIKNENTVTMNDDKSITIEFEPTVTFQIPGQFHTIREALTATDAGGKTTVRDGDTLVISAQVYNENNLDIAGRAITITSEHPDDPACVAATIINCGQGGRAFILQGGETNDTVISGLTIINGDAVGNYISPAAPNPGAPKGGNGENAYGGAICSFGQASPLIVNCIFRDCVAGGRYGGRGFDHTEPDYGGPRGDGGDGGDGFGGALYFTPGSNPTIRNCQIISCRAIGGNGGRGGHVNTDQGNGGNAGKGGEAYGGAMYFEAGCKPKIQNCTISGCDSTQGLGNIGGDGYGTGYIGGAGSINGTQSWAGAIYFGMNCEPNISDTIFTNNTANTYVTVDDPNLSAYDHRGGYGDPDGPWGISSTSSYGGANYYNSGCKAELIRCQFNNNAVVSDNRVNTDGDGGAEYYLANCQTTIIDCNFINNSTGGAQHGDGAALAFLDDCTIDINNSDFIANTAAGYYACGGGIYWQEEGTVIIRNSSFSDNESKFGGGLYWYGEDSSVEIIDSNISDNTADHGGGLYWSSGAPTITACDITENTARGRLVSLMGQNLYGGGGGLFCWTSDAVIQDCQVKGNSATGSGGGVYFGGAPGSPTLKNCLVVENSAIRDGGGVVSYWFSSPTISNCTIADNRVTGMTGTGGGLSCSYESYTEVIDSIIWDNSSSDGSQIAMASGDEFDPRPSILNISFSDIGPDYDPNQTIDFNIPGSSSTSAAAGSSEILVGSQEIYDKFDAGQEKVKIIVSLHEPSAMRAATEWNSPESVDELKAEIARRQSSVLSALLPSEYTIRHLYENHAAVAIEVTSQGLDKLLAQTSVKHIEPVRQLHKMMAQAIPLANVTEARQIYDGTGIAIAIVDTGIDYTHPMLGGGGFPNNKVIGGYDTAEIDNDPIPVGQAHGTCCAGIAAGDLGLVGDYIGGVAPNAKIYALKASLDYAYFFWNDDVLAAWDWCITHRNDDPDNPIMIISNSLGGSQPFDDAQEADEFFPAFATAADTATSLGITILAASGNDGFAGEGISWPSAMSKVISVGAVYDTTDEVTEYSNTAEILDILAPGDPIYTTDIVGPNGYDPNDYVPNFGGTSAACPFAAGAVASLQNAASDMLGRYLTPTEVRNVLVSTGDAVTDTKVDITRPRLNLGAAVPAFKNGPPVYIETGCTINGWTAADTNSYDWDVNIWDYNTISEDPNFILGYYLSWVDAGQDINSPCVDAGSKNADDPNIALHTYTTRTDGANDVSIVDMGYHYPAGLVIYQLTVLVVDANGEEITDPNLIYGWVDPNKGNYFAGEVAELTAIPDTGYRVKKWTGTNNDSSFDNENTVTMTDDIIVTVEFEIIPTHTLTVTVSGGHGSAAPLTGPNEPTYIDYDPVTSTYTYYDRDMVTLVATPDPDYYIDGWFDANDNALVTTDSNLAVFMDSDKAYYVKFRMPRTLNVPGEFSSIQQAFDAAKEGDKILLATGTYITSNGYYLYDKDITITSTNPDDANIVANTVIELEVGPGGGAGNAFTFINTGSNTVIDGITIRGFYYYGLDGDDGENPGDPGQQGVSVAGGGIICFNASPTIRNCVIRDCYIIGGNGGNGVNGDENYLDGGDGGPPGYAYGGGLACLYDSHPMLTNCSFINCYVQGGNGGDAGNGYDDVPYGDPGLGGGWYDPSSDDLDLYRTYTGLGGAVYVGPDCSPVFNGCSFIGNRSYGGLCGISGSDGWSGLIWEPSIRWKIDTFGGAVYCDVNSSAIFSDCVFNSNIADTSYPENNDDPYISFGGAVAFDEDATAVFKNCTFNDNLAAVGGAMYWLASKLTIIESDFMFNTAYHGGGLYCVDSNALIMDCNIAYNIVAAPQPIDPDAGEGDIEILGQGAGLYCDSSWPQILNTRFNGNYADASGGAAFIIGGSTPTFKNCLITNNEAARDGAGISVNWYSDAAIYNCSIVNNIATGDGYNSLGGGLFCCYDSNAAVINTIIWDNIADNGPQIAIGKGDAEYPMPSSLTVSYSDIKYGEGGIWVDIGCMLNWNGGNLTGTSFADPLFVTYELNDYFLSQVYAYDPYDVNSPEQDTNSPCVDAGDSTIELPCGTFKYTTRTDWGMDIDEIDMGFHYYRNLVFAQGDLNYDRKVDNFDFDILQLYRNSSVKCGMPCFCEGADINHDGKVDDFDLAILQNNRTDHDNLPPEPNPMTWAVLPAATGESNTEIYMVATEAIDSTALPCYYQFECRNSNNVLEFLTAWQAEPNLIVTSLAPDSEYAFKVRAVDHTLFSDDNYMDDPNYINDPQGYLDNINNHEPNPNNWNTTEWSLTAYAVTGDDITPPTPNPMTWAVPPASGSLTSVVMAATVATDNFGGIVEYYFECVGGGGDNSGWLLTPSYTDDGLNPAVSYGYRVKARDESGNETAYSQVAWASPGEDLTPPAPDPMTWDIEPAGNGADSITMAATTAIDTFGSTVEYYFDCVAGGGNYRDWSTDREYTDSGLNPTTLYSYKVKARDEAGNETEWSQVASAMPGVDEAPPLPDPMEWLLEPNGLTDTSIYMIAVTAVDASGSDVQYEFDCYSGGGPNSGWQDEPNYIARGLDPNTEYGYRVRARDESDNRTDWSIVRYVVSIDDIAPKPDPMTWAISPYTTSATSISMTAAKATDISGVEYYFECLTNPVFSRLWYEERTYEATGLTPDTNYTFRVKARDKSSNQNETGWSDPCDATTWPVDLDAPAPPPVIDPCGGAIEWDDGQYYHHNITCSAATDASGVVLYYFENSYNSAYDSQWITSTTWDVITSSYPRAWMWRVRARDPYNNITVWSPWVEVIPGEDPNADGGGVIAGGGG